jgi:hypothetical protein
MDGMDRPNGRKGIFCPEHILRQIFGGIGKTRTLPAKELAGASFRPSIIPAYPVIAECAGGDPSYRAPKIRPCRRVNISNRGWR